MSSGIPTTCVHGEDAGICEKCWAVLGPQLEAEERAEAARKFSRQLIYGGGLQDGHTHMATVSYPILKKNGNADDCPACIAIEAFMVESAKAGWHMTHESELTVIEPSPNDRFNDEV